eukprot:Nk52_evm24s243 gene=Nk52_evmTU24s243
MSTPRSAAETFPVSPHEKPPAGVISRDKDSPSAKDCITPLLDKSKKRSETPPLIKKYSSLNPPPGEKKVIPSFAEDPPIDPNIIHGVKIVKEHGAAVLLNPEPVSELIELIESKKRPSHAPKQPVLGKTDNCGQSLPERFQGEAAKAFGIPSGTGEVSAKELIHPEPNDELDILEDESHPQYILSHSDYYPGEQCDRKYDWSKIAKDTRFGMKTVHRNDGKVVAESLRWRYEMDKEKRSTIVLKAVESFKERTQCKLGEVHDPIKDTMNVGPDHTFGIIHVPDEYNAGDLVHQRHVDPKDLSKDLEQTMLYLGHTNGFIAGNQHDPNRRFGVPSIRADIRPPKIRSCADRQNYGDESSAQGLISPSLYSNHGVYEKDLLMARSKDEIRELVFEAGMVQSEDDFETIWQVAEQIQGSDALSMETFRVAKKEVSAVCS